jgi:glycosyltransferase involved in cell wall biosynthesis
VTVLAPTYGDAEGQVLADKLRIDLGEVIYLDAVRCPVWAPGLVRYTRALNEAAMRSHFGRMLAERRKTFFARLLRMPRVREAELIHAHFMGWAFEVAVPLSRILGVPVTVTAHNFDLPTRRIDELRYLQRHAAHVVLVSRAYERIWAERTGSIERLTWVPNGIDLTEFPGEHEVSGRPDRLRIISVSRLVAGKRIADALHALARLRRHGVKFEYICIGEGPELVPLERLAGELGLAECISFRGAVSHEVVVRELCRSHLLLHPSEWESFGIAVAEAMAAGLPVVAARSPGPSDTVAHGVSGFLYEPGDIASLTNHLHRLAVDPESRRQFGQAGRARIANSFSWEAHMRGMFGVWSAALGGSGSNLAD